MKKIALIRCFCTSQEKEEFLIENIKKLRSHQFDIALASVLPLSLRLTSLSDYSFYTKDNLILNWPEKAIAFWADFFHKNKYFRLITCTEDYGFAVLNTLQQISQIFINYNYDYFYHLEYDTVLDNVGYFLDNPDDDLIFSSQRDETIWRTGTHLMILNKDNLQKLISEISKEKYLKHNPSGDAYSFLYEIVQKYNWNIVPNITVKDKFFHFQNIDFFNLSKNEEIKFFVIKDIGSEESVKILFYGFEDAKNIKIQIENIQNEYIINSVDIIDLKFLPNENKTVKIFFKENEYDISLKIKQIKNNSIQFF